MAMDGLCRKIEGNVTIQKSWGIVAWNYANTNHIDNDWNYKQFHGVVDFVTGCCNENLVQYLKRYKNVFQAEYVKLRLPLSTCCNWLHDGWSDDWTHIQYFCVTDAGLAFDIYPLIYLIQPSNNSLVHFMVACLVIRLLDLCGYQVMEKWQPQFALVRDYGYLHGVTIGHLTAIKYKRLILYN